jgi:hypothetical protein
MSTDRSIPVKTHGMFIVRESEHLSALPVSRAFNAYMDLTQISPHYVHERTKSWGMSRRQTRTNLLQKLHVTLQIASRHVSDEELTPYSSVQKRAKQLNVNGSIDVYDT